MADKRRPPSKEGNQNKGMQRYVSRPPIQVPTLPQQPQKTLHEEINAVKNQTNRGGMENLSVPRASTQTQATPASTKALADNVRAAQNNEVRGVGKLSEGASVSPDTTPAMPQSATTERHLSRTLASGNSTRSAPPNTTPSHVAQYNRQNLAQQNSRGDERPENRQDKGKEQEQAKNKNRDKGKDNER